MRAEGFWSYGLAEFHTQPPPPTLHLTTQPEWTSLTYVVLEDQKSEAPIISAAEKLPV